MSVVASIKAPPLWKTETRTQEGTTPSRKVSVSLEGKKGNKVDARNYRGNDHWISEETMDPKKYFGFIYCIIDVYSDKNYIGKKQYTSTGSATRGKVSNWQWYISSSDVLSETIKIRGKDDFLFVMLEQYGTRGGLSYAETWSMMRAETPSNSNKWYNRLVNKVSWPSKERITDNHKRRLDAIIDGTFFDSKE